MTKIKVIIAAVSIFAIACGTVQEPTVSEDTKDTIISDSTTTVVDSVTIDTIK